MSYAHNHDQGSRRPPASLSETGILEACAASRVVGRQAEIVVCLFRSVPPKSIGDQLEIAPSTVRSYTARPYPKLGVGSKEGVILRVVETWRRLRGAASSNNDPCGPWLPPRLPPAPLSETEILEACAKSGVVGRQAEIVLCLFRQVPPKSIGDRLEVAPDTVRSHTMRLYPKLGVGSKEGVILRVVETWRAMTCPKDQAGT